MVVRKRHEVRAQTNKEFAEFLLAQGNYLGWSVSGCFYSALHQIDSWLDDCWGYHPTGHKTRETFINRQSNIPQHVLDAYYRLKKDSEKARYDCWDPSPLAVRTNHLPALEEVEQFVQSQLQPVSPSTVT
ncbi:MAG: hypothetical protein ABIK79_02410 [Chloroflexota bacterium]|nr:hypothetical protein [Anaerolineae bacterium]